MYSYLKHVKSVFFTKRKGASFTGYGLIVGLIAVISIFAIENIGKQTAILFDLAGDTMENAVTGSGTATGETSSSVSNFSFIDISDASSLALTSSDIIQISISSGNASVSISGDGNPSFRICADSSCSADPVFGNIASLIQNGEFLQIRATASGNLGQTHNINVNIDSLSDDWQITTNNYAPVSGALLHLRAEDFSTGLAWQDRGINNYSVLTSGDPAAVTDNGFPAVEFDGIGDYFQISTTSFPAYLSIFIVADVPSDNLIIEQSVNANINDGFWFYTDAGSPFQVHRNSSEHNVIGPDDWFRNFHLGEIHYNGNGTIFLDGGSVTVVSEEGDSGNTSHSDALYIGTRAGTSINFTGTINEIIIYAYLSPSEQLTMRNFLLTKYGL